MDKQTESLAREKFEERVRFHYQYPELDIEPEGSPCAGEYVCTVRQDEWVQWKSAWQASRESLVVELPETHAHLIWIQAGRGPDDYWDDVEISRSEKDKCCDGSDRYEVYAKWQVEELFRAIGIRIKGEGV